MDFSLTQIAALAGLGCVLVMLVYVAALRSQYRLAEAERKRTGAAEARLQEEQRLSRSMMDNTSDLMAIYRIEGEQLLIAEWNRALRRFYAESAPQADDQWIGRPIDEFLTQVNGMGLKEVDKRLLPFRQAAATKQTVAYSTTIPGAHGPQYRESLIVPLTDAAGRVTHLFYRAIDVSGIRHSEEEQRRSAERFTRIFEQSPVATAIAGLADGRYLQVNAAWCALTGFARDEAIGRTAEDIGFWADDGSRLRSFGAILDRGETVQLEHTFTSKQGKTLRLLISAGPIELDGERRALAIIQDITRLEEARALATRLNDQLAGMFNLVPNALAISHAGTGRLLAVNDAWARLYGWLRAEVLGRTAVELGLWVDPADRREFIAAIERDGRLRPSVNRLRARDGREVLCLTSAEVIEWQGESALLVSHQDITEVESLRREAQALGERFIKLFHTSPVPTLITRMSDGLVLEVNDAYLQSTGFGRDQLRGASSRKLGMWVDFGERDKFLKDLRSGDGVRNRRMQFRRSDGALRDYLYSGELIDWHGEQAIVSFPVDVTELEEARREAQAMGERFVKLFETSPVPTLITRFADGRILEINQAYLDSNGYTRERLAGGTSGNLGMWIDPAGRERFLAEIANGTVIRNRRLQFRNGAGEVRDYIYSAERIDWHGEAAVVSFPVDVTELEHARRDLQSLTETLEERVKQRTAALEEANRELESFSYSVSHDLRAPLRALSGFGGLLARHPAISADVEASGHARRINAAASRMGVLVDALLQFARLSRQEVALRPVNLAEEVESVIAELGPAAAGRRLRWVVEPLPTVRGDPSLLRLVLQNLLDNALKYSRDREEAVIEIGATHGEGETVVRVKDNGVGFDMQYAGKVFGVFERLHSDSEFEGTGIGLASAQRIVQRHAGRIWCESAPGEGAAFYFSLPD